MITKEHLKAANEFGQSMMFASCGVSDQQANAIKGFSKEMEESPNKRAFEKSVVSMTECMMRESGNMNKMAYHLARQIDEYGGAHWPDQFSEFSDIALRSIGRVMQTDKQASERADEVVSPDDVKSAAAKWLWGLAGKGISLTPDTVKALIGISAGTGAAIGGLGWKMNRDTHQDEDDLEAMRSKIDTYDRISNEIESELQDRSRAKIQ